MLYNIQRIKYNPKNKNKETYDKCNLVNTGVGGFVEVPIINDTQILNIEYKMRKHKYRIIIQGH